MAEHHNTTVRRPGRRSGALLGIQAVVILFSASAFAIARDPTLQDLRSMSVEELGNIQVLSVSRRPEPLADAPGAIYVITGEAIRRSGADSLPEALRLAPNLIVARRGAADYAISARGFNSFESANKLLVQIDGRSVYTALHGGVFWDENQVALADIDRIEVVSGPGGALWGANAFSGVINIVTKSAADTQGGLVDLQAGDVDQSLMARYGGSIGSNAQYRVYGLGFERGETLTAGGDDRNDDWDGIQGGFRLDGKQGDNRFGLQGDIYEHNLADGGDLNGYNILARIERPLRPDLTARIRVYYDSVTRDAPGLNEGADTFDVDAKLTALETRNTIVLGGGYRLTDDLFDVTVPSLFFLEPDSRTVSITNIYGQDEFAVNKAVSVIFGLKYEYSSFSGGELLPNVRVSWQASEETLLWSAISRSVRTPSRIDRDLLGTGIVEKASDFGNEEVIAYEAGYRGNLSASTLLSVSVYYNDYDDLRVLTTTPGGLLKFGNKMHGHGYGAEAWAEYQALPWWRLSAGLNYLDKELTLEPTAVPVALVQHAGNDPDFTASLRSQMDFTDNLYLDLALRGVDALDMPHVPGYVEADASLGLRMTKSLILSLTGTNLLDAHHPETGAPAGRGEVRRSWLVGVRAAF